MYHWFVRLGFVFLLTFLPAAEGAAQKALAGKWRCHLECPGGEIQFGLNIEGSAFKLKAFVTNGNESIPVESITATETESTFRLDFDHYDSFIRFALDSSRLSGVFKKTRGADEVVELKFGGYRESEVAPARAGREVAKSIDGRWMVDFESSDDPAVGVFKTNDDGRLSGTFLTTTGDYRYLDGEFKNGKMQLSCFDGAHAFLFLADLKEDGTLKGDFWSSNTWHEPWTAKKDMDAKLPDAFEQTVLTKNHNISEFKFPNLDGELTSLVDEKFNAPARLIYVFGSWCPNCHDAAVYFKQLQSKYGSDLSILGLAFELTGDFSRDADQVKKYLKRHDVDYPVLVAGLSDKKLATKSIPFLDRVRSYPTTIFVDAKNEVVAIHTGFTGPATGDAYEKLKTRFETIIQKLVDEN